MSRVPFANKQQIQQVKEVPVSIPAPKNSQRLADVSKKDLVPTYNPTQSYSDSPAFFLSREDARQLKREGKGFFHFSGRIFCLISAKQKDWEEIARRYGFRDESCCIQAQTMFAFLLGERRAVAAVNAWA